MREPVEITDPADPRIADYLALTDVDLRTHFEPPHGLFIAEGELVIRRAFRAGYRLRSILCDPKWLPQLADLDIHGPDECDDIPRYVAGPAVMRQITGYHVHRGALASVNRRPLPTAAAIMDAATRVAVLENVNTHTNVGAIFRCAAGLGMDAVLLSPSCADPLYRRSVRVSMGEVFAVPYARLEPWPGGLQLLRDKDFQLLALTPEPDATPLHDVALDATDRAALLLGAEGPGLSAAALGATDCRVRIPMAHGVDSLNVAAAAAVACYVVGRR